jgi:hypothetical protein
MTTARPWKKWLKVGKWWLRRRIKSISSQPIVFRQPRLRALLPNETTRVPCVAAKPALADLRPCALALGTLERGGDTDPTLTRRNHTLFSRQERPRPERSRLQVLLGSVMTAHSASSDIRLGSQGGSHTTLTSTFPTPGTYS